MLLHVSNLPTTFPLTTLLEQNERFLRWKSRVGINEIKKLFVGLMHDKKVIYKVSLDETVDLPSVVRINLQYLAKLAGYSDDLYISAKKIASEEKYSACVTEPQKLPKRDQDLIDYHGSRNDFAKYDLDYSGVWLILQNNYKFCFL